jgi:formyl-CoA transferase
MILGELGADVIKIEPPEGDETRYWAPIVDGESVYFMSINRNKRSIVIDLKTSEGREIFYRLVEKSDVVIENFRPDVPKRLGIDYETLKKHNDKLIYCAIRGFGSDSPYRDKPSYDLLIQALSGLMLSTGRENDPPVRVAFALFDIYTGMIAAITILSSLVKRMRSGEGSYIEVSLYDTAIFSMTYIPMIYLVTGNKPKRYGHAHPSIVPYQAFLTRDNKWIAIAVTNDRFWSNLCKALEREDLCTDPRFRSNPDRVRNREELIKILEEEFRKKTREEWLKILEKHDVPAAPVYELDEVFKDPHVVSSKIVVEVPHTKLGSVKQIVFPAKINGERPSIKHPPPILGEHTDEILREIGFSDYQIRILREKKVII